MRKILFCVIIFVFVSSANVFAEPIIELTAPRSNTPKIIQDDGTRVIPKVVTEENKASKTSAKKQPAKKIKKYIRKKPPQIKVDYDRVSKLIEYNYFDYADKILEDAICRNPKDLKAQSLWVVSLAKQCKLDPAQAELDVLLKKYPENSNLHYAQGVVYYQRTTSSNMLYRSNSQKLISDAIKEFKKAIELDKTNARAYNAMGVISLNLGNTKEAEDYFKKSIEADKTYSLAIDNLGTMDLTNGKFDDAEKKFKQSLVYNTQNTTAMYHLAQIAIQKEDYATALIHLNNALAINNNSPAIYNLMGKAYRAQGNEAAAINSFKKSLVVKPEFILSYFDLAEIYEKRGDGEFAIEQLKTALTIDPEYNDAKLKIADISLSNAKYKQSIDFYAQLVGVDGYNDAACIGLANAYYAQAQIASSKSLLGSNQDLYSALECINKAISANGDSLELHLAKLKLTKLTNQPEQSQIALQKMIQSPATDLMSTIMKGEAYLTLSDFKNAEKTFDSAINMSNNIQDDMYLSEIFAYHKQYNSAEKMLQKVLKQDPKNKEALSNLDYIQKCKKYANNYFKTAQAFVKAKNYPAAMEYLSRSLTIDPNNAQAQLLSAQLFEAQKNYTDALTSYKIYLGLAPNAKDAETIKKKIKTLGNRL